eukprot:CAMPEP_0173344928 /NCGR_PEP_ID=MMETSP1144-20121109/11683_1 /TAXON_ID=483371 /ORGANISM="non described non described, Strain CCMP2298" /LENGTH=144 /DNA_ID=CAMNT_0014291983 /DNA_START=99 /DNA_END=530 /DNA_ORIENTATION=+
MSGMTVPMRDKPNCDFSYAGLKNSFRLAVQRAREENGQGGQGGVDCKNAPRGQMQEAPEPVTLPDAVTARLCADFQQVAFLHVQDRLKRALDYLDRYQVPATALVVVGGVAANQALRATLAQLLAERADRVRAEAGREADREAE